uniref:Nuclear receptor subfamily 1 group I member 2 n=1 Tax=Paramormyrops kingsleyae TaxID=1676925 RepID=A0A3B3S7I6_9TELE
MSEFRHASLKGRSVKVLSSGAPLSAARPRSQHCLLPYSSYGGYLQAAGLLHCHVSMNTQELRRPTDDGPEEDTSADEEDEEPKVCHVCGDQATGYHFNALTCEGCKGFFRRAMKRPASFSCPFRGNCVITKSNRRQCQACRLKKCQSIGMLKELIMSDEELEQRRHILKQKRKRAEPLVLSPQQEGAVQELLQAQRSTFDVSFVDFKKFRPIDRNLAPMHEYGQMLLDPSPAFSSPQEEALFQFSSPSNCDERPDATDASSRVFITLPHIADLTTYMIQQIISFAKLISYFRELSMEDQISLLKGAMFEVCQIRFNMLFNDETGVWECGALSYCMDDAARAGFQRHLLDPLMKFHYTLRKLRLDDTEYVLMQAISLFSPDRPGVTDQGTIDRHQEMVALMLKTYIESKRMSTDKRLLFPKIVACLTELRSMNEEYTKQVLEIQDIQPDVSPLILEVVSKDP